MLKTHNPDIQHNYFRIVCHHTFIECLYAQHSEIYSLKRGAGVGGLLLSVFKDSIYNKIIVDYQKIKTGTQREW